MKTLLLIVALLAALPAPAQDFEREPGRVIFGVALASGGVAVGTYAAGSSCAENLPLNCPQKWGQVGALYGLGVLGYLFATVWADVPVGRNLEISGYGNGVRLAFRW